jgi:hypothetical protein
MKMAKPIKDKFPESKKSNGQNWQGMNGKKDLDTTQNDL